MVSCVSGAALAATFSGHWGAGSGGLRRISAFIYLFLPHQQKPEHAAGESRRTPLQEQQLIRWAQATYCRCSATVPLCRSGSDVTLSAAHGAATRWTLRYRDQTQEKETVQLRRISWKYHELKASRNTLHEEFGEQTTWITPTRPHFALTDKSWIAIATKCIRTRLCVSALPVKGPAEQESELFSLSHTLFLEPNFWEWKMGFWECWHISLHHNGTCYVNQ